MPVGKYPVSSTIRLNLVTGLTEQGNPIIKQTNLSNVKTNAVNQDIYDVATALVGLQEYQLDSMKLVDIADLILE
jgi:hypothetical protein